MGKNTWKVREFCQSGKVGTLSLQWSRKHMDYHSCILLRISWMRGQLVSFPISLFTARKRSLGQGNIFRSVCQEFCLQRGSTWHPQTRYTPPPGPGTPPGTRYTPRTRYTPWDQVHPPCRACCEIRSTRGRYASYWNALLWCWGGEGVIE